MKKEMFFLPLPFKCTCNKKMDKSMSIVYVKNIQTYLSQNDSWTRCNKYRMTRRYIKNNTCMGARNCHIYFECWAINMVFPLSIHLFSCLLYKGKYFETKYFKNLTVGGNAIIFICRITIYNFTCAIISFISAQNSYKTIYFI